MHCAGLDARILSLERQLADLQVVSEDEGVDAMETDDRAAPIVDSPSSPGIQGAKEGLADDEEGDGGDGADEDEEDDEETASDDE